jgi:serine/threonine-protein kinase CTR1
VASNRGSFGEVSKCIWKGTLVAVKKYFNVDDKKFVQEAQMMHTIQHPNCVRMFGACTVPYQAIVMEWMGGRDLSQFLAQRPLPKMHRRLSLFRQICAGLNSLHSHSPDPIIHSDLKSANILLDSDQKVAKIADFGLSKIKTASYAGSACHAGMVGTVLYLAPEMLLKCFGCVMNLSTQAP